MDQAKDSSTLAVNQTKLSGMESNSYPPMPCILQKCGNINTTRSPVKTDIKERECKNSTNFSTFPNRGDRSKGANNKTFTSFDTFPEIENIVAGISDCLSFSPREKSISPPAPTKYLNSLNLKSVNKLTAIDPNASPEANKVIYLTSIIKKHYSKNVINKMSNLKMTQWNLA